VGTDPMRRQARPPAHPATGATAPAPAREATAPDTPGATAPGAAAPRTTAPGAAAPETTAPGTAAPTAPGIPALGAAAPGATAGRTLHTTGGGIFRHIEGFTSASGVAPGESLDFRVTVDPPHPFGIEVYRIGYYGGAGAAKITTSPRLAGVAQLPPLTADRTVSCHHWWLSWRLRIPSYWSVGAYVSVLETADGHRSHIPFTVRDARPADLLLVLPDVSWQAYNAYPQIPQIPQISQDPQDPQDHQASQSPQTSQAGRAPADGRIGAGLCHARDERGRLLGAADAARTVSFDRPYPGTGLPLHVQHAYDFIRWAERAGYDLAYAEASDLHAGRVDPTRYRGLVFPGPDEFWSGPMRRAVERARDGGTSLVFLSAATMSRQVDLGPSPTGPDRLLTCCERRDPGRAGRWRTTEKTAEQRVLGIQYAGWAPVPHPLVVHHADHWLWQHTGAGEGDELPGLVAGEADRYFPRICLPPHTRRSLLAHSPYRDARGAAGHQETSLYRAPSGALVFASGTSAWTPALDRPGHVDPRVQRATANLLDRIRKSG
jgi:hypothetical protein